MTGPVAAAAAVRFAARGVARRRLLCLPFAGGGVATYRTWAQRVPDDVEVVAVALPGRAPGWRGPVPDTIAELVDAVVELAGQSDDLPFAVFGHSMGALIAFETALALEAGGNRRLARLFVSGRRSPSALATHRPINGLDDDAFLDALDRRYGGVPEAVRNEPDLLALLLPPLRADIRALETYVPRSGRLVQCPVHVLGGSDDRHPNPTQLHEWQDVAARPITVRTFPGDHFYLNAERQAVGAEIGLRWPRPTPADAR